MEETNKKECPIPATHNRLKSVYELWYKTAGEYQNPDSFMINLNAIIQEMRNITWILQSEKKMIPEFDSWYERWQKLMDEDKIMKWLKNARNKIVKQGDLETNSVAKVKILTWEDVTILETEIPPFISIEHLATYFANKDLKIPDFIRGICILNLERRWRIPEFPAEELLDLLAYCFKFLEKIISEAHQRCKVEISSCKDYQKFLDLKIPLAIKTFSVSLSDKRIMTIHNIPFKPTEKEMKVAGERYKLEKYIKIAKRLEVPDPFKDVNFFLEHAKRVLSKDKYHINIAFLYFPDDRAPQMMELDFHDQSEKFLGMRYLADEIDRIGATGIIFIGEVWTVEPQKYNDMLIMPSQNPRRKEALVAHVATSDGRIKTYSTKFTRGLFNRIKFDATKTLDMKENNFLEPILKMWREKQKKEKNQLTKI